MEIPRRYQKIINLDAIKHNLGIVKGYQPNSKILAIVKSNAYGHGIGNIYPAIENCDGLGVSDYHEGIYLRELGFKNVIVLLNGFHSEYELKLCYDYNLTPVIHNSSQVEMLEGNQKNISIWLKIDSGMNRLGFSLNDYEDSYNKLIENKHNKVEVLVTHLFDASSLDSSFTKKQYDDFIAKTAKHNLPISISNSAGIIGNSFQNDWVRPGIMLYGASPINGKSAKELNLQPAMNFISKVIQLRDCFKGDTIGYNGTFICEDNMKIGIVPIGYGDGFSQNAPSGTPIIVNDSLTKTVGKISMEKLAVDLTDISSDSGEYNVQIWGDKLPIDMVANYIGTSSYELFCNTKWVY